MKEDLSPPKLKITEQIKLYINQAQMDHRTLTTDTPKPESTPFQ